MADVIEKLRAEKAAPPDPLTYQRSDLTMEREMDVCEVCGALILIGDTQLRIEDHILGKQHDGYAKLRAQFNIMKVMHTLLLVYTPRKWHYTKCTIGEVLVGGHT